MNTAGVQPMTAALIVEDEQLIGIYLAQMLNDVGIDTVIAGTAAAAMQLVSEQAFNLMFIDLGLPDQSGLEVIDAVQRDKPSMKIVISTGYTESVLRDSIIGQRNVRLLSKPYAASELVAALSACGIPITSQTT